MGEGRAERESNLPSDPNPDAIAPKKPRFFLRIRDSSIGYFQDKC